MTRVQERDDVIKSLKKDGLSESEAAQQADDLPQPTEEQWLVFDALVQAAREDRLLLVSSITNPGRVFIAARSHDDPKVVLTLATLAQIEDGDDTEEAT